MNRQSGSWWSIQRLIGGLLMAGAATLGMVWLIGMLRLRETPSIPEGGKRLDSIQPTVELAEKMLANYFAADDDAGKIQCLHDSRRVGELWRNYHHQRGKHFPLLDQVIGGTLVEQDGRILACFEVVLSPGGRQPVALIWEGDCFRLDWESLVAYGTMDWIEWLETKPAGPQLLRVYLSRVPSGPMSEQGGSGQSVVVEHRDSLGPEVAVIAPNVPFTLEFSGRQRVPATAEFEFRQEGGLRRLYLTRLLHEGWTR